MPDTMSKLKLVAFINISNAQLKYLSGTKSVLIQNIIKQKQLNI